MRTWRKVGWAAVASVAGGCAADSPDNVGPIRLAWLEQLGLGEVSAIVGGMTGGGLLRVVLEDGSERTTRVHWGGGTVGFGAEVNGGTAAFSVPFGLPDRPVGSDELFGWYTGSAAGIAVVGGVEAHHLHRGEIHIDVPTVMFGANAMIGFEWMKLDGREPWSTP